MFWLKVVLHQRDHFVISAAPGGPANNAHPAMLSLGIYNTTTTTETLTIIWYCTQMLQWATYPLFFLHLPLRNEDAFNALVKEGAYSLPSTCIAYWLQWSQDYVSFLALGVIHQRLLTTFCQKMLLVCILLTLSSKFAYVLVPTSQCRTLLL